MRTLNLTDEESIQVPSRLRRIWGAVVWFVTESDYQFAEVIAVCINLVWLVALLAPGNYLETTPALEAFETMVGEPTMILACLVSLVLPAVAIVTGSVRIRRGALIVYSGLYAGLSAGVAAVSMTDVVASTSFLLLLASAWGYLRLGGKHR